MATLNQSDVQIQVLIDTDTEFGRYQDSLYFTIAEFTALADGELVKRKKDRTDAWVERMRAASKVEYNPTDEELLAEKQELEARIQELDAQINDN